MTYRIISAPRLLLERAQRDSFAPIDRINEKYQHLTLENLRSRFAPPAEPVPPAPEPAAEPEAPATQNIEDADRTLHMARVFAPDAIAESRELLCAGGKSDSKRDAAALSRSSAALDRAARDGGWRSVPWAGPMEIADPFSGMGPQFANFAEVIAQVREQWTLARHARHPGGARIDPILLVGPPGVGKSYFAASIADQIGERISIFSAGGAQDAMQLCGTDTRWSNARTGIVFDLLAMGNSAAPILVIDELDKLSPESGGNRDTPINTLLDLFESDSARRYRDMSLQLEMDASRIILVCTANERERISPPLLSRLTEFHIKAPSLEQRRLILGGYLAELLVSHECPDNMTLDETSAEMALATSDLDVRELLRLTRAGFAAALASESDRVILAPPRRSAVKRRIGFT